MKKFAVVLLSANLGKLYQRIFPSGGEYECFREGDTMLENKSNKTRRWKRFILVTSALLVLMVGFAYGIAVKSVTMVDGERTITIKTLHKTVGEVLAQAGIRLNRADKVIPGLNAEAVNGMNIEVVRAYRVKVISDGEEKNVITVPDTVEQVLAKAGVRLGQQDKVFPNLSEIVRPDDAIRVVRVESKEISREKEIPFSIVRKDDRSLERGLRRIIQQGEPGKEKVITKITYEDGVEIKREIAATETLKEPRNQVVALGTIANYSRGSRNFRFDRAVEVAATGYTHTGNRTYTGVYPEVGTVAVDPRVIPLGTKLYVEGYGYAKAEDIGSAIKGQRIDLFFDTKKDALSWGRRRTKVYVLE